MTFIIHGLKLLLNCFKAMISEIEAFNILMLKDEEIFFLIKNQYKF